MSRRATKQSSARFRTFQPGTSGNGAGRKKGSRNRRTVLEDEVNKTVVVSENGKRVRKTKWHVIIAQQVNKAASGDLKAAQLVFDYMTKYGLLGPEVEDAPVATLDTNEQAIFEAMAERIRASQSTPPIDEQSADQPPSEKDNEQ